MAQTGLQEHKEQVHVHVHVQEIGMRGSQGVAIRHAFFQGVLRPPSSGNLAENVSMLHENVVGSKSSNYNYHHLEN